MKFGYEVGTVNGEIGIAPGENFRVEVDWDANAQWTRVGMLVLRETGASEAGEWLQVHMDADHALRLAALLQEAAGNATVRRGSYP